MAFRFETANERWKNFKRAGEYDWEVSQDRAWDERAMQQEDAALVARLLPEIQQNLAFLNGNELRDVHNYMQKFEDKFSEL